MANALIPKFAGRRIAVVGDVMLDHFIVGHVDRISPEAPVPVVRFSREEYRLGGAANVAHNVTSLGGQVTLIGLTGADPSADLAPVGRGVGQDFHKSVRRVVDLGAPIGREGKFADIVGGPVLFSALPRSCRPTTLPAWYTRRLE